MAIAVSALVEEQEDIVGRIWCQAAYADTDGLASTPIGPANVLHDPRKGPGIRAGKKGSTCPVVNLVEKVGGKGDATIGYDPFGAHAGPESTAVGEEVNSVHGGVAISKKIDRNDGEAGVKIQVVSTAKFIDGSCDDGEGRAGAEAKDGRQGDGRTEFLHGGEIGFVDLNDYFFGTNGLMARRKNTFMARGPIVHLVVNEWTLRGGGC